MGAWGCELRAGGCGRTTLAGLREGGHAERGVGGREGGGTWISLRSLSHKFCRGSMKFCLTSMSRESFTSARRFMDSPASSRASPAAGRGVGEKLS